MLGIEEIRQFISDDAKSRKKLDAKQGDRYYNAEHDIKDFRLFYYNSNGDLVEDTSRSNIKISHPFFTELVDQAVQYVLSGDGYIIKSDDPKLQTELNMYFNENEDFIAELSELLTGCQAKGFEYMYAYKNEAGITAFMCADSMGVVEVEARFASDKQEHKLYWYVDRVDKDGKTVKKIMDWTTNEMYSYTQIGDKKIELDKSSEQTPNPKPHTLYKKGDVLYQKESNYIPFFRIDNNKKQVSSLKVIKPIVDDYDLHACSLSNNLVDFDTPIHLVKGFEGDDLDELQQNIKTKKIMGMESTDASLEVHTVEIPYQARLAKLELDEKSIYRFGMGLNTAGLKDTSATTNIAIKAAYSLLDLKCSKLIIRLKQFLRKLIKIVLSELNENKGTDYQMKDVYFNFKPEVMSNEKENADIKLVKAQEQQTRINTLLDIANHLGDEILMQNICEVLDIDYEEIKSKLPKSDEVAIDIDSTQEVLRL